MQQAEPVQAAVPVGWLCSPDGDFKRNLLYRIESPPQSIAWQVPVYAFPKQAEPSYFGLTNDHTWLSVSKEQYDKLKPQGRMACIVRSEK